MNSHPSGMRRSSMFMAAVCARLGRRVISGQNVLYQLMRGECTLPGEWDYLSAFRNSEHQAPPVEEPIRQSLLRRQLVLRATGEDAQWTLKVPLLRRWLRMRG